MKILLLILSLTLTCHHAQANGYFSWQRIKENSASPINQKEVQPVLWTGLSSVTLLLLKRDEIGDPLQSNWSTRKPLGHWAEVGDISGQMVPNLLYTLGMWGFNKRKSIYMLESSLYAGLFTTVAKVAIGEKRPNGGDRKSFPSGHATTAFAFAASISFEHSLYAAVPAYALATLVAASRINDNAHYLHDVVAGATVGIAFASGIHHLNKSRNKPRSGDSNVAQLGWRWTGTHLIPNLDGNQIITSFVF